MLPSLIKVPNVPFLLLPPGIHWATLEEVKERFVTSPQRVWLFEGLVQAVEALTQAGCRCLYLDGSFVTSKENPSDYDGCWDSLGVSAAKLDPVLLDFENKRAAQKQKYRGELFVSCTAGGPDCTFLEFFQTDKYTGAPKGIVGVRLGNGIDESKLP